MLVAHHLSRARAHAGSGLERGEQQTLLGFEVRLQLIVKTGEGGRGRRPVAALGGLLGGDKQIVAMPVVSGKYLRGKAHGGVRKWSDCSMLAAATAMTLWEIKDFAGAGARTRQNRPFDESSSNGVG